jgi:hypothetical protein
MSAIVRKRTRLGKKGGGPHPRDGEKITRKERRPLLLRASMTLVVAPTFWRRIGSDKVRVRIAPATIAGEHVRPTFFDYLMVIKGAHNGCGKDAHTGREWPTKW